MNCSLPGGAAKVWTTSGRSIFGRLWASILLAFCAVAAYPQTQTAVHTPPSDLARQNFERVAAPAAQIEKVLQKDDGLMVELKRWVAKDATDHGQLVSDTDLTDQAIYGRLEADVQFRSVATALLQKYGYLLPRINPDSPQGKEQELLIQDRAKWIAQEQEEQLTQVRQQKSRNLEQTGACDASQDASCAVQKRARPAGERPEDIGTPLLPERRVPPGAPGGTGLPRGSSPALEQTQLAYSQTETAPAAGALPASYPRTASSANPGSGTSPLLATGGLAPGMDSGESSTGNGEALAGTDGYSLGVKTGTAAYEPESGRAMQPNSPPGRANSELSRAMVRQPVPYVAVPSLYDMYLQAAPHPPTPERFGMEVFEYGSRDSQVIPFDLPVGPDYVVGPGDGLSIDLWGSVSQRLVRSVDREGRVSLPEVGPLLVAGKSLADVQESVQKILRSQFRDVSADVSLSRLRTIRVYVVGDVVHPGAYDIRSLSTPLNALFAAGGPTSQGSLRILKHNRGSQAVQNVDVYDLLLHGVRTDIQRLENGDTVLVPPIGPEVAVEGMVRRPAIYELHEEKSLSDVLTLAGGLLPTATMRHIEVQRVVAHDKRTMLSLDIQPDADSASIGKQLDSFQVQDGDKIRVFPIAPYNQDTLYLEGHVLRPGRYSYRSGMRVTDLISSYKDLLPEPASRYAEIIRLNPPDYRPTVESFNLGDALAHPGSAPLLQPLDTVQVFGRYDFEEPPTVSVGGDVRTPGTYRTSGQIHLGDAIQMAGGLWPDAEKEDAQLFRYLPDGELNIFSVRLDEALAGNPADNIVLNSRDRILVHQNPGSVEPAAVYINGEVVRPGRYPLTSNMTVSDLIRAAGGFKRSAFTESADLTRYPLTAGEPAVAKHVTINPVAALAGDSSSNIPLRHGDVLTIAQLPGWNDIGASVSVRGEVQLPGTYGIRPGDRLSSVLERAGGFLPTAYPQGIVFERDEVRRFQEKSRQELIQRIQQEAATFKTSINASAQEAAALQQAALEQRRRQIEALQQAPVTGRIVVRMGRDLRRFEKSPDDIELRDGDSIYIPKRPDYVLVTGQVYNSNAISFAAGRNAAWYLQQAGGPTDQSNKKRIFIVRANGAVVTGQGEWWSGSVLGAEVEPGDMIVVPEKAIGGGAFWKNFVAIAQVAEAAAITAAVVP